MRVDYTLMKKRKPEIIPKSLPVKPQRIQNTKLAIPKLEYKVVAQPILETTFTGHVTTIPTILIFYLNPMEFKVAAVIIQETMETGVCILTTKQIAIRLKASKPSIYNSLYALRKMGIIYEERQGRKVARALDFNAIQHLNDLLNIEDRGVYRRLRDKARLKNINNITSVDLERIYDKHVLPADHDVEEEEEYD